MLNRPLKYLTLALSLCFAQSAAIAQEFLSKPVRIVVPQTPGGASDALARIVGQKLSEKWGQAVVIENRAGAGGNVGMEHVAQATADGHTLLMSYAGSHAINAALYKKLPFDPEKDFEPVATLATLPFVLVVRPDSPVKSIKDLVEQGQRSPLTYGSAGNGSVNHLLGVMFNAAANTKLEHIPYRGAAPAMQDLMGGQINMVFTSLPSVSGAIKSGTLRCLATGTTERISVLPDVPTVAEFGFKDFETVQWYGIHARAGTPPEIIQKLQQECAKVMKSPEVMAKYAAESAIPGGGSPGEYAAFVAKEQARWKEVVIKGQIKPG